MRIVFAGTPDFAVPALDALAASSHSIVGVLTQPDRPAGRGRRLLASAVKQRAVALKLPVFQPQSLKHSSMQQEVAAMQPDLMVVVAYGLLLPRQVLDMPPLGCLNIHASLLPRWRGAAPIQRAILAGDRETGVCLMQMDAGLDTGPVIASRACPIDERDTAGELHDRLSGMGAELLVETLPAIAQGSVIPQPQDESEACYAPKVNREEARLDWRQPAAQLSRAVLAWNPWPGAYTEMNGQTLKIWRAEPAAALPGLQPGVMHAETRDELRVATGAGSLRLLEIQFAGGKRLQAADALHGRDLHHHRLD